MLVFWLLLIDVAGSLASKIGSVENNDAQTWLPASAQSTRALAVAEQYFAGKDTSTAVVVYARASGLTAADLGAIDADRKLMASRHAAAGTISAASESGDGKAAFIAAPFMRPRACVCPPSSTTATVTSAPILAACSCALVMTA